MVQREMEKPGLGEKVECTQEQTGRFSALVPIPKGKDRAASCRPPSVLAPGSALGSCRHGALSSARAALILRPSDGPGNRLTGIRHRTGPARRAGGLPPLAGGIELAVPLGEDLTVAARQLVGRRHV